MCDRRTEKNRRVQLHVLIDPVHNTHMNLGVAEWADFSRVHLDPSRIAKHRFSPFFRKMYDEQTYTWEKNQTSKVSLCGKRTGSKKNPTAT